MTGTVFWSCVRATRLVQPLPGDTYIHQEEEGMPGVGDIIKRLVTGLKARLPLSTHNLSIHDSVKDYNFLVSAL